MKLIIIGIAIASSSFTSCNNDSANSGKQEIKDTNKTETAPVSQKDSASVEPVLAEYLKMKNALVAGKSKDAADAG